MPSSEPHAEALRLVEQEIVASKTYETKDQLWGRVRGQVNQEGFNFAISRLLDTGKIAFDEGIIVYTGVDNPKLKAVVESSLPF